MARIMVSLPDGFLRVIDKEAKKEHRSRSELLREAVRSFLGERETFTSLKEDPDVKLALKIQNEARRKFCNLKVDSSQIIRHFREK